MILVSARANGNQDRNGNANKANHAKSNATRLQANLPQGRYESVDGKKLAKCISMGLRPKEIVIKERRTTVISATPTPPICLMMPCAAQYCPVVTIPR